MIMPIPQVNDRIKEAPVVVLRAVFAGIGQLLLTADKVRTRAAEQVWTPDQPAGPGPVGPSPSWAATATKTAPATNTKTAPAAKATTKAAPTAKATIKSAPATKAASTKKPAPTAKPASPAKPAPAAKPAAAKAASTTKAASEAKTASAAKAARAAKPAPAEPPLPGYDDLSLPSLRARLRTLDATAIKAMLDYEKAHARRDEVITMLERRLAKITAE
jgi:hypothetical protein